MPIQPPEDSTISGYAIALIFTLLGGIARIFFNISKGGTVSLFCTFGSLVLSLFASSLVLALGIRFQWQITGIAISCGLAAWSGSTLINILEKRILNRLEHGDHNKK